MITVEFDRLTTSPGFRILDIGCGTGRHTSAAYRLEKISVIGADLSFNDVLETKKSLEFHDAIDEHGGGIWGVGVTDITRLPFRDGSFDLVVCSEVLEHIPDEKTAIREIIRVLKPGRDLVVSVPRYFPERICWAISKPYTQIEGGHIRIYRKEPLVDLLEDAGTTQWAGHWAHSIHTPYWWLKCLVGPDNDDNPFVRLYHRFLTWDIMKHPPLIRFLDKLLNPILGKSVVVYLRKDRER